MRVAEIIGNAIDGLGLALTIYLFNLSPMASEFLNLANPWLLICMLTAISHYVVKSLAELYHESLIITFSTSISIFVLGLALSNISQLIPINLPLEISVSFSKIIFWSFTATAALISLLIIFKSFSNLYLNYLERKIESNIGTVLFLLMLALIYFMYLRQYILEKINLLIPIHLAEWGVICLAFWLFYKSLIRGVNANLTETLNLGDWEKLRQELKYHADSEQLNVSRLIEDFINEGEKDGILTYIISVLLTNGVKEENIRRIVRKLLDFQDIPYPKICFRSWLNEIEKENIKRRKDLLNEILGDIRRELFLKGRLIWEVK
jgi:hypothetical protein